MFWLRRKKGVCFAPSALAEFPQKTGSRPDVFSRALESKATCSFEMCGWNWMPSHAKRAKAKLGHRTARAERQLFDNRHYACGPITETRVVIECL